jgi:hypothetical protein
MFSTSISFHRAFRPCRVKQLLSYDLKHRLPNIQPCYAFSPSSSPAVVSLLRDHRIPMICHNAREASVVGDDSLVIISGRRFVGQSNECIVRSVGDIARRARPLSSPPLLWLHTTISHDGIYNTREMFEYIWAHKYIVNGIVFDVNNFSNPLSYIPPTMYSYKIALNYLFRNIIHPFEKEYGIPIPSIMIDGRTHITQMSHLDEFHSHIRDYQRDHRTTMRLILGPLIDTL